MYIEIMWDFKIFNKTLDDGEWNVKVYLNFWQVSVGG